MSSFAQRLRTLRLKRNFLQKDMAERLGITESAYGYYEQGRREPSHETLSQLAEIFEVTVDYLLGRSDEQSPSSEDSNLNVAFIHGGEDLTDDEKEHLEEELKRYRELKARFLKEKKEK